MKKNYKQFLNILQNKNNIAIFGHESIDGDAIGSILSLGYILEKLGKKVSYFSPDQPNPCFNFLSEIEKIKTNFDYATYDLLIFLDFSPYSRIKKFTMPPKKEKELSFRTEGNGMKNPGNKKKSLPISSIPSYFKSIPTVIIDHHLDSNDEAQLMIKDTTASSNCERLLEMYQAIRPQHIDAQVATYLYLGLLTDTGNLLYEKNSKRTIAHAKTLIDAGADKASIIFHIYRNFSFNTFKFIQLILQRLSPYPNQVNLPPSFTCPAIFRGGGGGGGIIIVYSYYTQSELDELELGSNDVDYALSLIQNITGNHIICLFKIYPDQIKCSLRSKDKYQDPNQKIINVGLIASQLNGGGHINAAGCSIQIHSNNEKETQKNIHTILEKISQGISEQTKT